MGWADGECQAALGGPRKWVGNQSGYRVNFFFSVGCLVFSLLLGCFLRFWETVERHRRVLMNLVGGFNCLL